jgi:integrase
MVLRIEPEARKLFEPYDADGYLLGILRRKYKRYERIYECVSKGMKSLSEAIGKEFTFYSARHSWATIARNDCGIDKYTVHEALSHVDRATAIDDVYIAPDYSRFWKANREVLDRFEWHY